MPTCELKIKPRFREIPAFRYFVGCFLLLLTTFLFGGPRATAKSNQLTNCNNPSPVSEKLNRTGPYADTIAVIRKTVFQSYPDSFLKKMVPALSHCSRQTILSYLHDHRVQSNVRTDVGQFYPSSLYDISTGLRQIIESDSSFLDLGSGDGRVVLLVAVLGLNPTGIEYNSRLVEISHSAKKRLINRGLIEKGQVSFKRGDYFEESWAPYDLLYYYGSQSDLRSSLSSGRTVDSNQPTVVEVPTKPQPGSPVVRITEKFLAETDQSSRLLLYTESTRARTSDFFPQLIRTNRIESSRLTLYRKPIE